MANIIICIPTYKRPEALEKLLSSLETEVRENDAVVLIADNDSAGSSRHVASAKGGVLPIDYFVEPHKGVTFVRNALIERAYDLNASAVIFIDDDQIVPPGWFHALVGMHKQYPNDILTAPVSYTLSPTCRSKLAASYFKLLSDGRNGTFMKSTGTGNTLWPTAVLNRLGPRPFRDAFNEIGGEDTDLSSRAHDVGFQIRVCHRARVSEPVPDTRCTTAAVIKRLYGNGIIRATLKKEQGISRPKIMVGGILRIASGVTLLAVSPLSSRKADVVLKAVIRTTGGTAFFANALRPHP